MDGPALQIAPDVPGQQSHQALTGLQTLPAHVGGQDDIIHVIEGIVGGGRLGLLHVQAGPGDDAVLQGGDEGGLIHQSAPGGVDEAGGGLHFGQGIGVDEVAGLVAEGAVEGDEVAAGEQLVQPHIAHAVVLGGAAVGQDLHVQGPGHPDDLLADVARADDAQGLAVDLCMGALEVAGEVAPVSPGEHVELPAHGRGQVEQQHDGGVGHPLWKGLDLKYSTC